MKISARSWLTQNTSLLLSFSESTSSTIVLFSLWSHPSYPTLQLVIWSGQNHNVSLAWVCRQQQHQQGANAQCTWWGVCLSEGSDLHLSSDGVIGHEGIGRTQPISHVHMSSLPLSSPAHLNVCVHPLPHVCSHLPSCTHLPSFTLTTLTFIWPPLSQCEHEDNERCYTWFIYTYVHSYVFLDGLLPQNMSSLLSISSAFMALCIVLSMIPHFPCVSTTPMTHWMTCTSVIKLPFCVVMYTFSFDASSPLVFHRVISTRTTCCPLKLARNASCGKSITNSFSRSPYPKLFTILEQSSKMISYYYLLLVEYSQVSCMHLPKHNNSFFLTCQNEWRFLLFRSCLYCSEFRTFQHSNLAFTAKGDVSPWSHVFLRLAQDNNWFLPATLVLVLRFSYMAVR